MVKNILVRTLSLSLAVVFAAGSIFAVTPDAVKATADTAKVESAKKTSSYRRVLSSSDKHTYAVNVAKGEKAVVIVEANSLATVKVTTESGKVVSRKNERVYTIELNGTGNTTVEISMQSSGIYSLRVH